jgi:hypothetical protein
MAAKRKKKTRMGRPTRHNSALSETVLLRLTPTQMRALKEHAAEQEMTVPELIRSVLQAEIMPGEEWEG